MLGRIPGPRANLSARVASWAASSAARSRAAAPRHLQTQATSTSPDFYDVVIVGGGAIGSSIAYYTRLLDPACRVLVVERDSSYAFASSALSVGSIRQQFSVEENIKMSLYGVEVIREMDADSTCAVNFDEGGYSFIATEAGAAQLKANTELQQSLGAKVDLIEGGVFPMLSFYYQKCHCSQSCIAGHGTPEVRRVARNTRRVLRVLVDGADADDDGCWLYRNFIVFLGAAFAELFPWCNGDDVASGTVGTANEGWFDPYALTTTMRQRAVDRGADYLNATVVGLTSSGEGSSKIISGVDVVLSAGTDEGGERRHITCGTVANAAGCWSSQVLAMALDQHATTGAGAAAAALEVLPVV